jgi:hypothetical protein
MKTRWFKTLTIVAIATLSFNTLAAEISHVSVRQRWPWSRLVDIDYVIADAPEAVDITVSAFNGGQPLVLDNGLSGDLYGITGQGARRIIWDPTQSQYTNAEVLSQFRVTLTPNPVPLYMIVDLTKEAGAEGQIEYVYEADLTNGLWGAWVRNPVTNALGEAIVDSVVWTGAATNDIYKTDRLVLRRVPAGSYTMGGNGYPTYAMSLTKACYVGVFEVTQGQWQRVMGQNPSGFINPTGPVEKVSYEFIRGSVSQGAGYEWPTNDHVYSESFIGRIRKKISDLAGFDLPTEAQWEYACRAGTTSFFNDGIDGSHTNQLNNLGWWSGNSGSKTHTVGQKTPNAWGLYDMHGNVWEWCLDWNGTPVSGSDPAGADSGSKRVIRGGSFDYAAVGSPSSRSNLAPSDKYNSAGFRLFGTLP